MADRNRTYVGREKLIAIASAGSVPKSLNAIGSALARGMDVNNIARLIGIISLLGMLAMYGVSTSAFAQAGSTGGAIGKTDKSASGGEEKVRPRRTRNQFLRASKPERQSKRMHVKSSVTPRIAFGGQWKWTATCAFGNWGGVITIVPTTASTFHGSFGGQGPADVGIITDGKLRGKHISFFRNEGTVGGRYDLDLVSMEPPTVKGYHVHPITGACHFTATKM